MTSKGHTVIGCSRSQDKIHSLQASFPSENNNQHLLIKSDVRLDSNVAEMAKLVFESKGGPPDIIVNNAGTINKNNRLWEVPAEEFDTVIDTNIKGIANVLRHFLPSMVEKKGIVVNMSSGWGRSAAAQVAPYCASKWAIEGMTRSGAKELPEGMTIVALSPGVINTDMLASCFGSSASMYQTPEARTIRAPPTLLQKRGPLQCCMFQPDFVPRDPKEKPKRYKDPAYYNPYGPKPPPTEKIIQLAERIAALPPEACRQIGPTLQVRLELPKMQTILVEGMDLGPQGGPSALSGKGEEKKAEKTAFDVKLEKFDVAAKIKVIKEVRAFTNLGLKEAKDLVEKSPVLLKQGVTKEEADGIIEKLKAAGGVAVME